MFRWLLNQLKSLGSLKFLRREHECKFMVLGVMEASTGNERTVYGVATCTHLWCGKHVYFPEENWFIHEKWKKEGKSIILNFEKDIHRI